MDEAIRRQLEQRWAELLEVARRYTTQAKFLGSDLDEALSNAAEYFCLQPFSPKHSKGVFRICLRRALAKRLKSSAQIESWELRPKHSRRVTVGLSSVQMDVPAPVDCSRSRASLLEAVGHLPVRLGQVVSLKIYGENGKPFTLKEIGYRLRVSDERVRQLLQAAYAKLRPACEEFIQS